MMVQAQNAKEKLLAAGLDRKDFTVRTERIMNGRTFVGYGNAQITLLCPRQKHTAFAAKLAEHFRVTQYKVDGVVKGGLSVCEGNPGLEIKEL